MDYNVLVCWSANVFSLFRRVIDVFLSEGISVIFQIALALLHLGKEDLLSLDMEGMLKVCLYILIIYIIF